MLERVFLSDKQIILGSDLRARIPNMLARELERRLNYYGVEVKNSEGSVWMDVPEIDYEVTLYGVMVLEGDKACYIVSIAGKSSLVGMYFYQRGDDFLTEMVDPDSKKVHQVIKGKRI